MTAVFQESTRRTQLGTIGAKFPAAAALLPPSLLLLASLVLPVHLQAEPSWARKYNSNCTLCHTIYPRLNRTGYEFRRLGYRFPAEVEKALSHSSATTAAQGANVGAASKPAKEEMNYKPLSASPAAAAGKALVEQSRCATCHQIEGQGSPIAPSLDGIGGRRSPTYIREQIQNPAQHTAQYAAAFRLGGELMPTISASPQQIEQIVAYLLTLRYRPPAAPTPHPASTARSGELHNPAFTAIEPNPSAQEGAKLYLSSGCSACHSISGKGGSVGPALDGVGTRRSAIWMERHIANPGQHVRLQPEEHAVKTSAMPPSRLKPIQIAAIVDYLLTLPATQQQKEAAVPPNRIQDYFGITYLPAIEWDRSPGDNSHSFDKRDVNLYAAGTLGSHLSFFVQPIPARDAQGFLNHFEMIQGLMNFGGTKNYVQIRFGQIFDLLNAGFAGADRPITNSIPLLFSATNGFNPAELSRGASVEFTTWGLTTFKVFSGIQTPPDEIDVIGSDEGETPESKWSRMYGFSAEKVIGSKGLSGVQFQYAGGYTPIRIDNQYLPALRFQRYSFFANKTFQDSRNVERLNLIFGGSLLRDDRILGIESAGSSHGYGIFGEANWIPVRRLGLVARYDQLRSTTLVNQNTLRAGTLQIIYDITKYTRISFEYQHGVNFLPANSYRLGGQLNF
jgi:nitric oxide reductase subunit C